SIRPERRSPPVGAGEISPLALKRATQRTALAMLTPKRLAAALRDMPPSTTAPTTRSRRSSESAIPAASFARRQSSSRSKPIRESLPRFNSLGDRSSGVLLVGLLTYVEHGVFVAGALVGGSIGATLTSLEIFVLRRNAGAFFRRLPFLPYLGLRVLLYAGVILLVNAVMNWLITPDGLVINMSRADIVFTLVICVCTILLLGINDLLGPGALFAFVAGRY